MRRKSLLVLLSFIVFPLLSFGSEKDLVIPELGDSANLLYYGFLITVLGLVFGMYQFFKVKKLGAHKSMLDIAQVIFGTCKTYLLQQGKLLAILFIFIAAAIVFYFGYLEKMTFGGVALIIFWTILGILGSYGVAWFGIRMNTLANSRMAFASLERKPLKLLNIPLNAGMSIGVVLISIELLLMLVILLFVPGEYAGASFIGFAIGESLGASVLRIAGGIFTKIADIGSDLMIVSFKIGEDDPRNPGTIADCVGDNAGDSVGPTADGFETYGVTGVALISFILLAITGPILGNLAITSPEAIQSLAAALNVQAFDIASPESLSSLAAALQIKLLVWLFLMRILMVITSVLAFAINNVISKAKYSDKDDIDFEKPLTALVWITSLLSIAVTFVLSYYTIKELPNDLWISLSVIISMGTFGAAIIPEFTKLFTSPKSIHVEEVVEASKKGGASLNILSGLVAGNFSAFWKGMIFAILMFIAYYASTFGLGDFMIYPSIFAFGLVAFGMLGMGSVTIAVDSYGPVTDIAQSIYELSIIEEDKEIKIKEIEEEFGFTPDYEKSKYYLEANDGAGNTFKATAKPVLIGTAVVGATTMIFSLVLVIKSTLGIEPTEILNLLNPYTIIGFLLGGAVIYWFTGASIQAVTTGAARAVDYIKDNINLDPNAPKKADMEKSKAVVKNLYSVCSKRYVEYLYCSVLFRSCFCVYVCPCRFATSSFVIY